MKNDQRAKGMVRGKGWAMHEKWDITRWLSTASLSLRRAPNNARLVQGYGAVDTRAGIVA